jgi:hypothetical protein
MEKLAEAIGTEGAATGLASDAPGQLTRPLEADAPNKRDKCPTDDDRRFHENALMRWADDGGFCPPSEE